MSLYDGGEIIGRHDRTAASWRWCRTASQPANILKPETLEIMTTASAANPHYAKGWEVNAAHNWWHNGSLAGATTIAVRTHSGFCWARFTNTRRTPSDIGIDLDRLIWTMVREVKAWRA
jgi:hypothetical protein